MNSVRNKNLSIFIARFQQCFIPHRLHKSFQTLTLSSLARVSSKCGSQFDKIGQTSPAHTVPIGSENSNELLCIQFHFKCIGFWSKDFSFISLFFKEMMYAKLNVGRVPKICFYTCLRKTRKGNIW